MAVMEIAGHQRYIGLSTEGKPTGVPNGSLYFETDTFLFFTTKDNGTTWTSADQRVVLLAGTNLIGKVDSGISTLTIYNLTLTTADTEYSAAMPSNCRGWDFQEQTLANAATHDIRWSNVTGKPAGPTAPWATCKAGNAESSGPISQGASPSTLYFASATAGVIVEIRAWT